MPPAMPPRAKSRFTGPGRYRIEVEGRLRAEGSGRFGELRVVSSRSKAGLAITTLEGRVSDQAALAGVLNTLYELHLPLLSVQRLDDSAPAQGQSSD